MALWRDIKNRARRHVHKTFMVPALYKAPGNPSWVKCHVRVHPSISPLGRPQGTSYIYAERGEFQPEIIFLANEVVPVRGGIVSVEFDEAYKIDHTLPRDGLTITAPAFRLSETEAMTYPCPGDDKNYHLCARFGFSPKAQFVVFRADKDGLIEKTFDQTDAPYNMHTWIVGNEFFPYTVGDLYEIVVTADITSAIVSNYLKLEVGSRSYVISLSNDIGVVQHKVFRVFHYADTASSVPIKLSTSEIATIDNVQVAVSPRVVRGREKLTVGSASYYRISLNRPYPELLDSAIDLNLSDATIDVDKRVQDCSDIVWVNSGVIPARDNTIYDIIITVTGHSLVANNYLRFFANTEEVTVDFPTATGETVNLTGNFTVVADTDIQLSIEPDQPMMLEGIVVEVSPR